MRFSRREASEAVGLKRGAARLLALQAFLHYHALYRCLTANTASVRSGKLLPCEYKGQSRRDEQCRVQDSVEIHLADHRERCVENKPNEQSEDQTIPRPSLFLVERIADNVDHDNSPPSDGSSPNSINPSLKRDRGR